MWWSKPKCNLVKCEDHKCGVMLDPAFAHTTTRTRSSYAYYDDTPHTQYWCSAHIPFYDTFDGYSFYKKVRVIGTKLYNSEGCELVPFHSVPQKAEEETHGK